VLPCSAVVLIFGRRARSAARHRDQHPLRKTRALVHLRTGVACSSPVHADLWSRRQFGRAALSLKRLGINSERNGNEHAYQDSQYRTWSSRDRVTASDPGRTRQCSTGHHSEGTASQEGVGGRASGERCSAPSRGHSEPDQRAPQSARPGGTRHAPRFAGHGGAPW